MSGDMLSPRCSKSSPVLATISSSSGGRTRLKPSASLAPPTPPDRAITRPPLIEWGSTKQILARRPDQLGCRIGGCLPGEPAHHHDGLRFVALAHHQRGGGGDLVGKAADADLQGT